MSEIGKGYSWFPFDIEGWLSSKEVGEMNMADRGVWITLIATQGRDGKLKAQPELLSKQAGIDVRVLKRWLKKWGNLVPIIQLLPDTEVELLPPPCSTHAASMQQTCSKCAARWLQVCSIPAARWMQEGCIRVNPKLWNLQVKSGKFEGQPFLEEKRVEGILDLQSDVQLGTAENVGFSQVKLTMSANRPEEPRKLGFGV